MKLKILRVSTYDNHIKKINCFISFPEKKKKILFTRLVLLREILTLSSTMKISISERRDSLNSRGMYTDKLHL